MHSENILIVDAGGSSTTWAVINKNETLYHHKGAAFSPVHQAESDLLDIIKNSDLQQYEIISIQYYGAGIDGEKNKQLVSGSLLQLFPEAEVYVHSDLLAAAHATANDNEGLVCILGTGSNVAYFNGEALESRHNSLGYILGDEGSGAYLGKEVLKYYFYNIFKEDLKNAFEHHFDYDIQSVLQHTYKMPQANRYLAGFAKFLSQNRGHYMVENILEDGFLDFINHQVLKYREAWTHPIHYIGSISMAFDDVLKNLHEQLGLQIGKIMQDPMGGLIPYYQNKL